MTMIRRAVRAEDRLPNWEVALVRFTSSVSGQPWAWGDTDCVSVARRALQAIHGVEDGFRGAVRHWTTPAGAKRALKACGAPQDALRRAGARQVDPYHAHAGDVVLGASSDAHGMPQMYVLLPNRMALTSTPDTGVVVARTGAVVPEDGTTIWRWEGGDDR